MVVYNRVVIASNKANFASYKARVVGIGKSERKFQRLVTRIVVCGLTE